MLERIHSPRGDHCMDNKLIINYMRIVCMLAVLICLLTEWTSIS